MMIFAVEQKGETMSGLISRQALLEEYDRLHVGKPGRAQRMIEDALSAQPEQHWIPVTEKLPNDDKPVLLTEEVRFHDGRRRRDVCMASYDSQNMTWYEILGANILEIPYPIAWMKLSKPYQEEGKQK